MNMIDDSTIKAGSFRVVAIRPIVYHDPDHDHQYVIPEGMEGTCRGASKLYSEDLRLKVFWDAVAVWTDEAEAPYRSWIIPWWEDHDVRPGDVRTIALIPATES